MSRFVLDSSVILAVLKGERGGEAAAEFAWKAAISSVNITEIVTKCVEWGLDPGEALLFLAGREIAVVAFEQEDAVFAGRLASVVPKGVLSLGDRACIATAVQRNATAVTADRAWAALDLPCPIELIR
ncbi:MAG: type II toxin-antitoxin system VapC family toxin [Rhizobiaceae bacterium]|nr:type II toxin-antitoxin system VapC family toxin [Rhizobiaceae bacterium]MCV0405407.1 type II toxin-antitoxin system VapC family toxin [Rhizobiaceae bacterium]